MSSSSTRWLQRHRTDQWVKRSARDGYRSRSAYKLEQLHARAAWLLRPGFRVVDLGAAPGGCSRPVSRLYAPMPPSESEVRAVKSTMSAKARGVGP